MTHNRLGILTDRYALGLLGDKVRVFFLLCQSPVLTVLFVLVFRSVSSKDTFSLLLIVTAVWFGLTNACQEIVNQKMLFKLERRFGVTAWALLLSRLCVLSCIALCQVLVMVTGLKLFSALSFSYIRYTIACVLASVTAIALGLLISSLVKQPTQALALAPVLTIPQILFNDILIHPSGVGFLHICKYGMISHWGIYFIHNGSGDIPRSLLAAAMLCMWLLLYLIAAKISLDGEM